MAIGPRLRTDIVVIGAGQAGLSVAWHLAQRGHAPVRQYLVFDQEAAAGGAWQHRWPSLTLSTINRLHDLPGLAFQDALGLRSDTEQVRARDAVPRYFAEYERRFALPVYRPLVVSRVERHDTGFLLTTDRGEVSARGVVNATGTWTRPHIPVIPGAADFAGRTLHTRDYETAEAFRHQHVIIVGAGISALQLLDEISQVTRTTWITRREPEFREGPFDDVAGSKAVKLVDERVRAGLPPRSVVSVTGLPVTPAVERMRAQGVLARRPMFTRITPTGVAWDDGQTLDADVILWCTGFRSALDHLDALDIREPGGGIVMGGRLATRVERDHRIHLVGYGPSASTIGANRAGRAAVDELLATLSASR